MATVLYAIYTKRMAAVLLAQLKWSQGAIVVPSFEYVGPVAFQFRLQNTGANIAKDIRVKIESEPAGLDVQWAYPSLLPGESAVPFLGRDYRRAEDLAKLDVVKFTIQYGDVSGDNIVRTESLEIKRFRELLKTAPTLVEETFEAQFGDQVKELREVSKTLKRLVGMVERYLRRDRGQDNSD